MHIKDMKIYSLKDSISFQILYDTFAVFWNMTTVMFIRPQEYNEALSRIADYHRRALLATHLLRMFSITMSLNIGIQSAMSC